jgi:hypothetical protein
VYRLALRAAEGQIRSIFTLIGLALPVPDHTTLSRRGRTLRLNMGADAGRGLDLAIDSTGLRLAKPSGAGHEGWRKLHIAVDEGIASVVRALWNGPPLSSCSVSCTGNKGLGS